MIHCPEGRMGRIVASVKIENAAPRLLDHECRGQETLRRESTAHIEVCIQGTAGNQH